jgi:hypothetical protein
VLAVGQKLEQFALVISWFVQAVEIEHSEELAQLVLADS